MAGRTKRKASETADEMDYGTQIQLDNTAPLNKIIKCLITREQLSKAYKLYLMLLVQRRCLAKYSRNFHFVVPGHPLKAFEENWDGELTPGYFETFEYRSTMPKMISQMRNIGKSDPVTDFMQLKKDWTNDVVMLKRFLVHMSQKQKRKLQKFNEDVVQCPKYLIDLAAKLENNPTPDFESSYNWYYAGNGNMQMICVAGVDHVLHSDHTTVYLTPLNKDGMTLACEQRTSFDCKIDILETICSSQEIVALRTMNKVFILKIIEIEKHCYFDQLQIFESEMAFTSISFDKFHKNILYATRLDGSLSIVNLDRMKAKSVKLTRNSDSNLNNWNSVIAGERGTYIHVQRNAISFYDKRTNEVVNSWKDFTKIVDEAYCAEISAATLCDDSPSLYFATNHNIFLMDSRCSSSTQVKAGQRWMHGLKCVPTYISIKPSDNNKECVVVSSQWCTDTCVISNYADSVVRSFDIPGVSMPYHPPSVTDTLAEAQKQMLCLDLNKPIDERLAASITGQAVIYQGDNFTILSHNSLGDISLRILYPHYMESLIDDDSVQRLSEWNKLYEKEKKVFEVSNITDIANVWKKLRKLPDDYDFGSKCKRTQFKENEIFDAFENEELIPELLDAWMREPEAPAQDTSLAFDLHYDDSDDEE